MTHAKVPKQMVSSSALVPRLLSYRYSYYALMIGVLALSLLAQLRISLPWSLVPITGQTFGVTLMALLFGRRLSALTIVSYLTLGFCGLPVFAHSAGLAYTLQPTSGYLVGMFFSAAIVGFLADQGFGESFKMALLAGFTGSFCVLTCGAVGLLFFVPLKVAILKGIFPFLPGDVIKTSLAAFIASQSYKIYGSKQNK